MKDKNLGSMSDIDIFNMAASEALKLGYAVSSGKCSEVYNNLMLAKYGGQIKELEPIKPIDEHEWSDGGVCEAHIYQDEFCFEVNSWTGSVGVSFNIEDLRVILNAKGYDMVKRQSGDIER